MDTDDKHSMTVATKKPSFVELVKKHLSSANIGETSVLMAYYLLLSLFPLMIALGNVLPLFHISPAEVMPYIDALVPEAVRSILSPIISQLLTAGNGGLFSLGMIAVVWSAGNGVGKLEEGLDRAYGVSDKRHNLVKKVMSVVTVVLALFLVVALALLFGLGSVVLEQLSVTVPSVAKAATYLTVLKWPVTVALLLCGLTALYVWAPTAKVRLRDALPGTAFSAVGWIALIATFSLYIRFTAKTLSTYGVLSTFFLLMFWLNFACMILLFGAVLNAAIYEYRHGSLTMKKHSISQKLSDQLAGALKGFGRGKKNRDPESA